MVQVPVEYKMISDESEPSWCIDFSTFSDSSSSSVCTDEYDINNLLQRRTSISLFNVSTPLAPNERYSNQCRSVSHYNIHSARKKRMYKPYSNENKNESKIIQEPTLKIEHLEMPAHNLNISVDNISLKYEEALKEIESLKIKINKLKGEHITTPVYKRRKSLQSSMIKNLFRNSSTSMRQNHDHFATSLFGTNSTCMTTDIEDQNTSNDNDLSSVFLAVNNHGTKENPFFTKTVSPISHQSCNNSEDPLIYHSGKKQKHVSRMRGFASKFMKCPEFIHKIIRNKQNTTFNNRVSPIPKVVIFSSKTLENDSGNDSDVQQIPLDDVNCNTPNIEKVMKDLSKCAIELSEKLSIFQNVLEQCMNEKKY